METARDGSFNCQRPRIPKGKVSAPKQDRVTHTLRPSPFPRPRVPCRLQASQKIVRILQAQNPASSDYAAHRRWSQDCLSTSPRSLTHRICRPASRRLMDDVETTFFRLCFANLSLIRQLGARCCSGSRSLGHCHNKFRLSWHVASHVFDNLFHRVMEYIVCDSAAVIAIPPK